MQDTDTVFNMFLLNCRSLSKHTAELSCLLMDEDPDVLFLTETWMQPDSDPDLVQVLPPGFSLHRLDRAIGKGGGIAIFKSRFLCRTFGSPLSACENLHFSIEFSPTVSMKGLLIYRPPGPLGQFCNSLLEMASKLGSTTANLIILGDLNIHFDDLTNTVASDLLLDLVALQLTQSITSDSL